MSAEPSSIVRCVFLDDTKWQRQWHYTCPDAALGDIVQARGNSPARVVGFGRKSGYTGVCRTAEIIDRTGGIRFSNLKGHTMNAADHASSHVEQLADQLKAAKKAEKRARKTAAVAAAATKERARRHTLALAQLECVAQHDIDGGHRIAAALVLLDRA